MKKHILSLITASVPFLLMGQTAVDAFQLSRNDLRGTARFMSMAGAFGALGGDLSTLNQNPGGIGVYRKSEVGITLDIDMQSTKSTTPLYIGKSDQTKAYLNNLGYVGSFNTGSEIVPTFNWGFSYGRTASFDRRYHGRSNMNGSLSNYIAGYCTADGIPSDELAGSDDNYFYGSAPWLGMLAYNSYIISPYSNGIDNGYDGMWQRGTFGSSEFDVEEKGYVDEYSINFGGNISNVVYWGIGFGITDIEYKQHTYYDETMYDALIPAQRPAAAGDRGEDIEDGLVADGTTTGNGGYSLTSYKRMTGNGFNFKVGLIFRPINELRLGFAVHTPTYYSIDETSWGEIDYDFNYTEGPLKPYYTGTPDDIRSWKFRTPWRLMFSAAGIIGTKGIISVDYEYRPYQNMKVTPANSYYFDSSVENDMTNDIQNYYQSSNIIRIGGEYRITPNFSLRAGYAYETSPTKSGVTDIDSDVMVYTSNPWDTGTTPSYTMDNSTQYITCGAGYRYKNFSVDAAYVHKSQKSEFFSYTPYNGYATPYSADIKSNHNNIVLSVGYRF